MSKWFDRAFFGACGGYVAAIIVVLGLYPTPCSAQTYCGLARLVFDYQTLIGGILALIAGLAVLASTRMTIASDHAIARRAAEAAATAAQERDVSVSHNIAQALFAYHTALQEGLHMRHREVSMGEPWIPATLAARVEFAEKGCETAREGLRETNPRISARVIGLIAAIEADVIHSREVLHRFPDEAGAMSVPDLPSRLRALVGDGQRTRARIDAFVEHPDP